MFILVVIYNGGNSVAFSGRYNNIEDAQADAHSWANMSDSTGWPKYRVILGEEVKCSLRQTI